MGHLTWAQMRKYALEAMGGSDPARDEVWDHLNEGYRYVATHPNVRVPELSAIDESVVVTAGNDYVEVSSIDVPLFAIQSVFNVTDGFMIYPDPGGMLGRERLLTTTGKPPVGSITFYTRDGSRLYVRDTPSTNTTLRVRVLRQVPTLSDSDLNSTALTPAQYDWAIVNAAAANFYRIHPLYSSAPDGSQGESLADRYAAQANLTLQTPGPPEQEQDRVRREPLMIRGYTLTPRSRRW